MVDWTTVGGIPSDDEVNYPGSDPDRSDMQLDDCEDTQKIDNIPTEKLKVLLKQAYDHLEYCNWGDIWERECSEGLRAELNDYFE